MDDLDRRAGEAGRLLGVAVAADGPESVDSAALAAERTFELSVRSRSVAGVAIVERGQARRSRPSRPLRSHRDPRAEGAVAYMSPAPELIRAG
jgi:hypothetical protein